MVAVGFTVWLVPLSELRLVPSLPLKLRLVGLPVIVQVRSEPVPAVMLDGFAVKLVICGAPLLPPPPPETPGQAVSSRLSVAKSESGANLAILCFMCIFPPEYWGQPLRLPVRPLRGCSII